MFKKQFAQVQQKVPVQDSLWSVGHAEGCQVSIREGEQGHDGDKGTVVREDYVESKVLDVTHHEERDEDQTGQHSNRKKIAFL